MSALAQVLKKQGHRVGGSDRNFDRKVNSRLFNKLKKQGICLFSQNGEKISKKTDFVVVSTAIEKSSPELKKAKELEITILHRAELLSSLFNGLSGIGIAGTSGKSTVCGMVASVMDCAGMDPGVVNGGIIRQYVSASSLGNAKGGSSRFMVSEVDESDGSIVRFSPDIGVVTNISRDHKEIKELKKLFKVFAAKTKKSLILNGDCKETSKLKAENIITFGLNKKNDIYPENIKFSGWKTIFDCGGTSFPLKVPGKHNVCNALAAIAVCSSLNIDTKIIKKGLASFKGIRRRLELAGEKKGVTVVDDFAHNPDKILASLSVLKKAGKRLIVVFQPHGYGPTRFLLEDLAKAFSISMEKKDVLMCLPIYDAGGTADRSISSSDLLNQVKGPECICLESRKDALSRIKKMTGPGDAYAVMGARDDTLSTFAKRILREID